MRAHFSFLAVMLAVSGLLISPAHAGDASTDTTFAAASSTPGWQRAYAAIGDNTHEFFSATARTPDGGYLLAGSRAGGAAGALIFLAKFRPDGSYDSAFGNSVATGNAGLGRVLKDAYLSSVNDMTIDTQGRIIVVGNTPGVLGQSDFGVVRFNPDGTDDTSFAGDGGTAIAFDDDAANSRVADSPKSVAVLPDGSIYVVGTIDAHGSAIRLVGVARLQSNGSLDPSYRGNGLGIFCGRQCENVTSVARVIYDTQNHRLYIGGDYLIGPSDTDWFVIVEAPRTQDSTTSKYEVDLDVPGGYKLAYMTSLAIQPDGKLLASGFAVGGALSFNPVVLRLLYDSTSEDTGFGNTRGRGLNFVGPSDTAYNDLVVDSLGRIILAGYSGWPHQGAVMRLKPDGDIDTSFNGSSVALYGAPVSSAYSVAHSTTFKRLFLDGGKPVIAGNAPYSEDDESDYDLVITRLRADLIFANGLE